jgi:hypothetical protein
MKTTSLYAALAMITGIIGLALFIKNPKPDVAMEAEPLPEPKMGAPKPKMGAPTGSGVAQSVLPPKVNRKIVGGVSVSGSAPRDLIERTWAFRPDPSELGILGSLAIEVESIKHLPRDKFVKELKAAYERTAMMLGPERAEDLWRSLEPGNAEIAKAIDEHQLPEDTIDKWEELRAWGRAEEKRVMESPEVEDHQKFKEQFDLKLRAILNSHEAYEKIGPYALGWLGAEGPSDLGFGKVKE